MMELLSESKLNALMIGNEYNNPMSESASPEPQSEIAPEFNELFDEFPADVRWMVKSAWEKVPESQRQQLFDLIPVLPANNGDRFAQLLNLAQTQWQMAFGDKRDVAIVGPTNVGKSTLYNQLIKAKEDTAVVSAVPGTTRVNQAADAGLFQIIDTPGADAVGAIGEQEREFALRAAYEADFLIIMFDAVQGVKRSEQALFKELIQLEKPYLVVLNKMDLLSGRRRKKERQQVIEQAARNLLLPVDKVIPIAAQEGENLEAILLAIVKAEPALMVALGQALPRYRVRLAWQAIVRAASTSAVVALTPIPIVDFVPLVTVQAMLVLSIARIYNYKLTFKRAQELLGTMGMGYLGRTLFYELSKFGGPPGWVVSAAVAATTTVMVGYTSIVWFAKGEKVTAEVSRRLAKTLVARVTDRFKLWGKKRPSSEQLADQVADVLDVAEAENLFEDLR